MGWTTVALYGGMTLGLALPARAENWRPATEERRPDGHHFTVVTATNLPAFREEPDMPPDSAVASSVLVYYVTDYKETVEQTWRRLGQDLHKPLSSAIKASNALRDALPAIVVTRQLTTRRALVPAAEHGSVRQFFERIVAAEQSRVVLVRQ